MNCINSKTIPLINKELIELKTEIIYDNYEEERSQINRDINKVVTNEIMIEENKENVYNMENNCIYYRNDLLIARIVYQCVNCIEVFDTINDSHNHYICFHQNITKNSNNYIIFENNIESNCKLLTQNNCLENYANNNTVLNINTNIDKTQLISMKSKLREKFNDFNQTISQSVDSDFNQKTGPESLEESIDKKYVNYGCNSNNCIESEKSLDLCTEKLKKNIENLDFKKESKCLSEKVIKNKLFSMKSKLREKLINLKQINSQFNDHSNVNKRTDEECVEKNKMINNNVITTETSSHDKKCINNGCNNYIKSGKRQDICEECFQKLLKRHYYYSCEYNGCHQRFPSKILQSNHFKSHFKDSNGFECETCGKSFLSFGKLNNHKRNHTKPKVCDFIGCNKRFGSLSDLKTHQIIHSAKVKSFVCEICGKGFYLKKLLNTHKNIHTNPKLCDFKGCDKMFKSFSELRQHKMVHLTEGKTFKCEICGNCYKTPLYLNLHKKIHTNPIRCDFPDCGKLFGSNFQLKSHYQIHSSEPSLACDWPGCEFKTKQQTNLISHRKRHSSPVPQFNCDWPQCYHSFKSKNSLVSHIALQHKNERNFICDFPNCGKTYAIDSHLKTHKMMHSSQKRFACVWPHCGKSFANNYLLKIHLNVHTGERPFVCNWPECEARFGARPTLQTHKKLVHKCDYIRNARFDNKS